MNINMNKFILAKYLKNPNKVTDMTVTAYIQLHGVDGNGGRVASCNVPQEYRFNTLDNSPARHTQADIYKKLEAYVGSFKKLFDEVDPHNTAGRVKSLYLWGEEVGTGKTSTATALLNEFVAVNYIGSLKRGLQPPQIPAYFLDVNELQELYNRFTRNGVPQDISEQASRDYYYKIDKAKTSPLVVFDDIGVRSSTEAFRGDLHGVINYRVSNQLPSIYTSNIPIEDLETIYDKRLADRVRDLTIPLYFGGTSNRGLR